MFSTVFLSLLWFASMVWAAPVPGGTMAISSSDLTLLYRRAAQFSQAAYCSTQSVLALSCGPVCDALGLGVNVLLTGGDGGHTPRFFVAHDPSTNSIVVAHQGTDPDSLFSVLNDMEIHLERINTDLIPLALGGKVKVHVGFHNAFERTAKPILAVVQSAIVKTGSKRILVTGHSLGAAIATLDAAMLKSHLDPSVTVSATVFGSPRVGNHAFADFIDKNLGNKLARITNQADPVPWLPPRGLAYQHSSGEVHLSMVDTSGIVVNAVRCEGQENMKCSDGESFLKASVQEHLGPYFDGISFGQSQCVYSLV